MALEDSKNSKTHILASLLLMGCIVMFVGSLYYLIVRGPWIIESNYNPETVSLPVSESIVTDIDEPGSLGEALDILLEKGCTIVSLEINNDKYKVREASFQTLSEKAVKNQVVIVTTVNEVVVLSVVDNGNLWVWHP